MVISTLRILTAPQSRAEVVRRLVAQLGPTREQTGCHRCDLYQDIEDRDAITLVVQWESEADLCLHLGSEASRAILGAIELSPEQPGIHVDTLLSRAGLEVIESARGLRREESR